jgi:hypothetical protein
VLFRPKHPNCTFRQDTQILSDLYINHGMSIIKTKSSVHQKNFWLPPRKQLIYVQWHPDIKPKRLFPRRSDVVCSSSSSILRYFPRTPTFLKMSSQFVLGPPGTVFVHTASLILNSSGRMLQFGLCSAFSHLKSSTWSHWLITGSSLGVLCAHD